MAGLTSFSFVVISILLVAKQTKTQNERLRLAVNSGQSDFGVSVDTTQSLRPAKPDKGTISNVYAHKISNVQPGSFSEQIGARNGDELLFLGLDRGEAQFPTTNLFQKMSASQVSTAFRQVTPNVPFVLITRTGNNSLTYVQATITRHSGRGHAWEYGVTVFFKRTFSGSQTLCPYQRPACIHKVGQIRFLVQPSPSAQLSMAQINTNSHQNKAVFVKYTCLEPRNGTLQRLDFYKCPDGSSYIHLGSQLGQSVYCQSSGGPSVVSEPSWSVPAPYRFKTATIDVNTMIGSHSDLVCMFPSQTTVTTESCGPSSIQFRVSPAASQSCRPRSPIWHTPRPWPRPPYDDYLRPWERRSPFRDDRGLLEEDAPPRMLH